MKVSYYTKTNIQPGCIYQENVHRHRFSPPRNTFKYLKYKLYINNLYHIYIAIPAKRRDRRSTKPAAMTMYNHVWVLDPGSGLVQKIIYKDNQCICTIIIISWQLLLNSHYHPTYFYKVTLCSSLIVPSDYV